MLRVDIYRNGTQDCTNGGITGDPTVQSMLVVNIDGPSHSHCRQGEQALKLVEGNIIGTLKLVPVFNAANDGDDPIWQTVADYKGPNYVGPMFGGNFAFSSDSRWSEACGHRPIAIHDRFETVAQYEALSR